MGDEAYITWNLKDVRTEEHHWDGEKLVIERLPKKMEEIKDYVFEREDFERVCNKLKIDNQAPFPMELRAIGCESIIYIIGVEAGEKIGKKVVPDFAESTLVVQ